MNAIIELAFATLLPLVLTPCLLVLGEQTSEWMRALPGRVAAVFRLKRGRARVKVSM